VIGQAYAIVEHYASLKQITFETDIKEEERYLFECIEGDERRYLQILINFLSNAIKFSNKGGKIVVKLIVDDVKIKNQDINL
jgi:signal transduction histidine kinase